MPIIWVLRIKLRSSGLVAGLVPSPTEPSCWHPSYFLRQGHSLTWDVFKQIGGPASHRDLPVSDSPALRSQACTTSDSLLHGSLGSNSGPLPCVPYFTKCAVLLASFCFLRQDLTLAWNSPTWLHWPINPQDLPILTTPAWGL